MVYSLLTGPNKMLPHMFISSSKAAPVYGLTDELLSDYKKGRHLKASKNFDIDYCHKLIDYFKHCLALYTDWDCFDLNSQTPKATTTLVNSTRKLQNRAIT